MTTEQAPILVAIDNPALHPEAVHIAAATGRPVIDARDVLTVTRHSSRAHALLIDDTYARELHRPPGSLPVYFLSDDPAGVDFEAAMNSHAQEVFLLPAQAKELLSALGKQTQFENASRDSGRVIAVVGAAGGAGTSTVAAALARVASKTGSPTLIDTHRYSGGLDLLFGIEEVIGARWGDISLGDGDVQRSDLRLAFPTTDDGVAVLSSARTGINDPFRLDAHDLDRVIRILATEDLTIVDASPGSIPARCDLAVVVTPAEVRAAAAASLIVSECNATNTPVVLVARHRGWSGLNNNELERVAGAPVIAEVIQVPRLARTIEVSGLPQRLPGTLDRAAHAILQEAS
ncbi:hypothetical protein QP027_00645 [Corynebacterium breve]|uniref:Rv3660c-like CheY-like N-terminal domain-containing protein n=1 Tax=Corynebacterium breve TaxID=3049799 RepID=A0ABY8VFR4_9CORY|nr:septum site-determining protein Ssd [Corynebacterium breve]WIM67942.1 hypothetical protein QP027_00645 [Corynebacterium breve]